MMRSNSTNNSYNVRRKRLIKIMAVILAFAVGGSLIMSIVAMISMGI